jgi:5-methyltetrahydrofolate--homocysteine methyltransferase
MLGCNCGIGIEDYITVAGMLRAATEKPIWVKANAGMPEVIEGKVVYKMTPEEFAEGAKKLVEAGANIVGGCCGTSPEFITAVCKAVL